MDARQPREAEERPGPWAVAEVDGKYYERLPRRRRRGGRVRRKRIVDTPGSWDDAVRLLEG
jgi:hypothetical protein